MTLQLHEKALGAKSLTQAAGKTLGLVGMAFEKGAADGPRKTPVERDETGVKVVEIVQRDGRLAFTLFQVRETDQP